MQTMVKGRMEKYIYNRRVVAHVAGHKQIVKLEWRPVENKNYSQARGF